MDKVLDPYYTPLPQEHINTFSEKQKFMHFVFSASLQTDRGKKFVREHEGNFDAQTVYKKIMDFAQLL